jgi:hypothetical protein
MGRFEVNEHTKEFLSKLADLLEEFKASLEIEGDAYGSIQTITLEVLNPKTFDEFYDNWLAEHPGQEYPWNSDLYKFADYVDLGFNVDADKIRSKLNDSNS